MSGMNTVYQRKQSESAAAVDQSIDNSIADGIQDAAQTPDEDGVQQKGSSHAKHKGHMHAKGKHGHEGMGHASGKVGDSVEHTAGSQGATGADGSGQDPLGAHADAHNAQSAATGKHLGEVEDLASAPTSGTTAGTNAASTASTAMAGSTASSTAATQAQKQLTQVLSSASSTTSQVNTATDKYISAMRGSGATDAQISQGLTTMTSAAGAQAAASASALVEAAKAGINTDDSNKDRAEEAMQQSAQQQKQQQAQQAAQQSRAQAAAQAAQASSGSGGGSYDSGGSSDGGSGSYDSGSDSSDDSGSVPSTSGGSGEAGGTAADTPASQPTNQQVMSMDQLQSKVPSRLAAIFPTIEAAAKQYNLQPQLLVAIAMEESTGGSDASAYSNGGGMFQFTDPDTWKEFGTGSTSNDANSAMACAKYMASLLNQSGGNLSAALRAYNGPIGQGGNPSYQSDIFNKMQGIDLGN